jgi:hypothetical protein
LHDQACCQGWLCCQCWSDLDSSSTFAWCFLASLPATHSEYLMMLNTSRQS